MCVPTEERTREGWGVIRGMEKIVRFGTFNIRNVRNGGLESALLGLAQGRVYCGIIQEKKLANRVYMRKYSGFGVIAMAAPSAHRGSVAILYRKVEYFSIEELRPHGSNAISF